MTNANIQTGDSRSTEQMANDWDKSQLARFRQLAETEGETDFIRGRIEYYEQMVATAEKKRQQAARAELLANYNHYMKTLDGYVASRDQVNESYFRARNLLQAMYFRANAKPDFRSDFNEWLLKGGTLKLKSLLAYTDYNDSGINDFRAMDLMDTVSLHNKK